MEIKYTLALYCDLARIAYCSPKEANPAYEALGYRVIDYIDFIGVQGYVLGSNGTLIIVFRGTDGMLDVKADVNIKKHPDGVHSGFYTKAILCHQKIFSYTKKHLHLNLIFIGHSYGGALASIYAHQFKAKSYAFGSPRVFSRKFKYNGELIRVVNACDIVSIIPSIFMGYKHVGVEYYLTRKGELVINPSWWTKIKDRFRSKLGSGYWDHYPEEYLKKLK